MKFFLLFLSSSLVSADDSSYLFGFCANRRYWRITYFCLVRNLILVLTIFGLLIEFYLYLIFCNFFSIGLLIGFVVLSALGF